VILHGVLLGHKASIICSFCHKEKKKKPVNTGKNDNAAYNSLTPIYPRLTAFNAPPGQNPGNASTKGSP
jgi:hypothetical protein